MDDRRQMAEDRGQMTDDDSQQIDGLLFVIGFGRFIDRKETGYSANRAW
jgi:hypothetical protein